MQIKNANSNSNLNKNKDEIKINQEAKISSGIAYANSAEKEKNIKSNNANNDGDFLKDIDKDIVNSWQSDVLNQYKNKNNKSDFNENNKNMAAILPKENKLNIDEDDSDFDI